MKVRGSKSRLLDRHRARCAIRRRFLRCIDMAVCVGVIGIFTYGFIGYAEGSTDFQVRIVKIQGLRYLNARDVLDESGVNTEWNILFFDSKLVQARVEAMPYVKSCRVKLIFPDTVVLDIFEREPFATLMLNSHSYEIDEDCVVLRAYAPTEMPMVPFFTDVAGMDFVQVGEVLEWECLRAAVALWRAFDKSHLSDVLTVSELAMYSADDIRMYCDELPYKLRWGKGHFGRQVRHLEVVWSDQKGLLGCAEYLDLRFDKDLVCR